MLVRHHFGYIVGNPIMSMVVMKCRQCDAPMNATRKGRPEKLPANIEWLVCRQCNNGVEVINSKDDAKASAPQASIEAKSVDKLEFKEDIVITQYIRISKITGEDGTITTTKEIYKDPEYKTLIDTVKL